MAANGYIVVAPNRRGMPGHGVEWNEQISKDWGGQVMIIFQLLTTSLKKVMLTTPRLCWRELWWLFFIWPEYNNRFKTFIAHDGVFNTQSMFGTTEEVFFSNWDFVVHIGKGQCYSAKPIPHSTLLI
jgi:hypothetical protein